jgi:hypothetical protein
MTLPLFAFEVDPLEGWEARARIDFVSTKDLSPNPLRPNMVINRRRTKWSLKQELDHFRDTMEKKIAGLELTPSERFKFKDGASGFRFEVRLPSVAGPEAKQIQIFRLDEGIVTTFTATYLESDREKHEPEILTLIRSFRSAAA